MRHDDAIIIEDTASRVIPILEKVVGMTLEELVASPSAERKAIGIADDFLSAEPDSDAEAKAWRVKKISAAL